MSIFDGFFSGAKWSAKTNKQNLENRIKDSVLNLIIDRDQSFLKTARQNNFIMKIEDLFLFQLIWKKSLLT